MVLPIVAFGNPVLRKVSEPVDPAYPGLAPFITDLWDTMYKSNGVGIAAPQVNKAIRIFVVDTLQIVENFDEDDRERFPDEKPVKMAFLNPEIISEEGPMWMYNEGCLSIPKIREDVSRNSAVVLKYQDEQFNTHQARFDGITARVILHEYDHLEGRLFIDYLSPLQRRLIKKKLDDICTGKTRTDYKMVYPK